MFRSVWCRLGAALKSEVINGESSFSSITPPTAKYFLFTFQNQNVVIISKSRVTSIFSSISTSTGNNSKSNVTSSSDSSSSFVVSYLINSCGLSENEAITASGKLNFKTSSKPDSVLALLRAYGFTGFHISKLIPRHPTILSSNPQISIKPRFDFFISKGLYGLDLANFISSDPMTLRRSLHKGIIPTFDILNSIVRSDQNVVEMMKRSNLVLRRVLVKRMMVNLEVLRYEGVPETSILNYVINQPRMFMVDCNRFKKVVQKVKEMGFHHLRTTFLIAVLMFTSMTEASWRKKMGVYKRWGWSDAHIQSAFRKYPYFMGASEKKIMAIMNFLVNDMGYDSSSIADCPMIIGHSLKKRIIPRCSVVRVLVSKGLIKKMISIHPLSSMVDKSFLEKFVIKYEQEVPGLMKVFQGQLTYQQLLQN